MFPVLDCLFPKAHWSTVFLNTLRFVLLAQHSILSNTEDKVICAGRSQHGPAPGVRAVAGVPDHALPLMVLAVSASSFRCLAAEC